MTSTIMVTGATGFVGREIVNSLVKKNINLVLVIREGRQNLVDSLPNLKRVIITKDLFAETEQWWAEQCQGIDTIVHAAWYVEPGKYLQSSKNVDCLVGSLKLVKGAVASGIRRFIGIGTCFEYDLSIGILSINTSLNPLTLYASTKMSLYTVLSQWLSIESIEFAWCRLFYLYGEGEDERRFVPYLRKQLIAGKEANLTMGTQIRDYLDVAEAGEKIANVVFSDIQGPVNICSGVAITIRELAEKIADEYGRRDLLKFGMKEDNLLDPPYVVGIPTTVCNFLMEKKYESGIQTSN